MKPKVIAEGVKWVDVVDWNRRMFDSLIPLPDGTSYNAYLVQGTEKTALIDAVDPAMFGILKEHLKDVNRIDYIVAQHAEQDHAGSIPFVMEMYPEAVVVCISKAKSLLIDHLAISEERIRTVGDNEEILLGGKTLRFIHTTSYML